MYLGVDILQTLNEVEELSDSRLVAPVRREMVRRNKGERADVSKCLVRGWDSGKADPYGHLQGVCRC